MFDKKSHLLIFGKGFNYSEDGPGNRLVYHVKGCNLHCPWCSNPEGLKSDENEEGISVEELLKEILSCTPMFFDGGGVTFTGGEILCQADAMESILAQLKKNKIHTAVETNASLSSLKRLMPYIDYLIADFKHPKEDKLKQIIGASLLPIKENLKIRVKSKKPLLVRIPLIHGFNDDNDSLIGFAEFFRELSDLAGKDSLWFELLKYHEYGKEKWEKQMLLYTVKNGFISDKRYNEIIEFFRLNGIAVIKT